MIDQSVVFNQGDQRWRNKLLGKSGITFVAAGCFTTETTHQLRRYGHDIDPGFLCDQLNAHDGYDPGGLEKWSVVETLYPDVLLAATFNTTLHPASGSKVEIEVALKVIENAVRLGMIVGLTVDVPGVNRPGEPDHIVGCDYAPANDRTAWLVKDSNGGIYQKLGAGDFGPPDKSIYGVRLLVGSPIAFPDYSTEYDKSLGQALFRASQAYRHARDIKDQIGMINAQEIINKLIGL